MNKHALSLILFASVALGQPSAAPWIIRDSHFARANYDPALYLPSLPNTEGTLYLEVDRGQFYSAALINGIPQWVLFYAPSSNMAGFQSELPTDLGTLDAGFRFWVRDYRHMLVWSGQSWGWADLEQGSGALLAFAVPPTGAGWHSADGSSVPFLRSDGTIATVQLPSAPGMWFRQ